ncbi:hypothetical protein CALCODRAFT_534319 [Calocera cornea HHB12733]|uniref:Uncharacterized protein n=1 Tax=Calocera cornea HHB12733 TaxID=1353952 RepID=A0A165I4I0_9BASI|nr:hypothetical protein CALCODRAFT_534319 [Calocera cornea HHB12733]
MLDARLVAPSQQERSQESGSRALVLGSGMPPQSQEWAGNSVSGFQEQQHNPELSTHTVLRNDVTDVRRPNVEPSEELSVELHEGTKFGDAGHVQRAEEAGEHILREADEPPEEEGAESISDGDGTGEVDHARFKALVRTIITTNRPQQE